MAKHIDQKDIQTVKEILDSWKGKLTWDALVQELENQAGRQISRQSLYANPQIKEAFQARKKFLTSGLNTSSKPQTLKSAAQSIDRLTAENIRLKEENSRLLELFKIWQYNAHKRGLTEDQLNEPLPVIDKRS